MIPRCAQMWVIQAEQIAGFIDLSRSEKQLARLLIAPRKPSRHPSAQGDASRCQKSPHFTLIHLYNVTAVQRYHAMSSTCRTTASVMNKSQRLSYRLHALTPLSSAACRAARNAGRLVLGVPYATRGVAIQACHADPSTERHERIPWLASTGTQSRRSSMGQ